MLNVSSDLGKVKSSIEASTLEIDKVLENIENSKKLLEKLENETEGISSEGRELIHNSIEELKESSAEIKREKEEAEKSIGVLDMLIEVEK